MVLAERTDAERVQTRPTHNRHAYKATARATTKAIRGGRSPPREREGEREATRGGKWGRNEKAEKMAELRAPARLALKN